MLGGYQCQLEVAEIGNLFEERGMEENIHRESQFFPYFHVFIVSKIKLHNCLPPERWSQTVERYT